MDKEEKHIPQATLKNTNTTKTNLNININSVDKASRVLKAPSENIDNIDTKPDVKLDYYELSDLINACVNYISETGALTKLKIGTYDSNGVLVPYKEDEKIRRLFEYAPNPFTTWQELIEQMIQSYLLSGNTYIGFEKLKNYELWSLNPDKVEVVPHKTKFIEGYLYSKLVKYKPNELIHIRRGSIQHMYYGTSAMLDVLSDMLKIEGYGIQDLSNFYKNGSIPTGLLKTDFPLNEKQIEDLKVQFKQAYGGKNRMSTVVLPIGMDYKPIKSAPKDAMIFDTFEVTEHRVLRVFKLPAIVMGGNSNASYPYSINDIYRSTFNSAILPITEKIRASLELFFRELTSNPDLVIESDYSRIPYMGMITKDESEVAVKLFSSGITTANEMRAKLGFNVKKEEGFNVNYLPAYLLGTDVSTMQDFDPSVGVQGSNNGNSTPSGSLNPQGGDSAGLGQL